MIFAEDIYKILKKNDVKFYWCSDSVLKNLSVNLKNHILLIMRALLYHWPLDIIFQQKIYLVYICKIQAWVMLLTH